MSKFTTALAACGIHHVAIPRKETERSPVDWECPYCQVTELEADKLILQERDDKYTTAIAGQLKEISELQSQINQLKPFLQHRAGSYNSACCASLRPTLNPSVKRNSCDCGLQQALQDKP